MFEMSDDSGDVLGLRFSSQLATAGSRRPCPGTSQQESAETGAAAGSAVDAASIGKLLGILEKTLRYVVSGLTHRSNRHRKVVTGIMHASSSAETSSQSAPNVSRARNMRQSFTEHHELRR